MRRSAIAATLAVAIAATAAAAPAAAASLSHWPTTRITYRDHSFFGRGVAEAVAEWNAVGTPIRLIPARPGRAAQIDVYTPHFWSGLGGAFYPPDGRVFICRSCFPRPYWKVDSHVTPVIAHEIGHAIGLRHSGAPCSLMRGDGHLFDRCGPGREGFYRCGPQITDARALARLYGVPLTPPPTIGLCPDS